MTDKARPGRYDDEALWDGGTTLEADATKDAKVHMTLRVDPNLYKALLKYKQDTGARTITQALESALRAGFQASSHDDQLAETVGALARRIASHTSVQDQIIQRLCNQSHNPDAARELWKDSVQFQTMMRQFGTIASCDDADASERVPIAPDKRNRKRLG